MFGAGPSSFQAGWTCPNEACKNHSSMFFAAKTTCDDCRARSQSQASSQRMVWTGRTVASRHALNSFFENSGNIQDDANFGNDNNVCDPFAFDRGAWKRTKDQHVAPTRPPGPDMDWAEVSKMYRKRKRGTSRKGRTSSRKKHQSSTSSSSSSSESRGKRKRNSSESSRKRKGKDAVNVEELSDGSTPGKKRSKEANAGNDAGDSDDPAKESTNSEIDKAKSDALQHVVKLRDSDLDADEKRRQWRALLRQWHPDKHTDKELATAVFQFLQKARPLVSPEQ